MRTLALLLSVSCGVAAAGEQQTEDARLIESRALVATLGSELRDALTGAIKSDGPARAISVCQFEAPAIAARIGRADVRVGRTALRVRNPGNAADVDQRRILSDFERRLAAGEAPDGIEQFDQTYKGGARYMKAIVTQPMCVTCHGPTLAPEVATVIKSRYPDDEAVGFTPGSLRGAFVVEWRASEPPP
ncbi:MAG: DUF3365 domain-containing protein [Sinimarinibacterium sp.]